MRMQAILDSPFARPGSAPTGGGKKGEFRDWTTFIVNLRDNSEHVNAVISGTGGLQENRIFRFLKIHKKNRFSSKSKKCFRRSSLHDIQNQMEKLKKIDDMGTLRAVLYNFQLSSFGRGKMKFLKLSHMNGLDK